MWERILELATKPAEEIPSLARGVALVLTLAGALWTLIFAGVCFVLWALSEWLGRYTSRPVALLVAGLVGIALATLGLWRMTQKKKVEAEPGADWSQLGTEMIDAHPLEAVLVATAAGLLAGQTDSTAVLSKLITTWMARPAEGSAPGEPKP